MIEKNLQNNETLIYRQFQNGHSYLLNTGLLKKIQRCILFERGEQWNMDDDIKEFPKITLNVIKQIGQTYKSNIIQNEYGYLVNSTHFNDIRKIQDFLFYLSCRLNLKKKDLKAVADDYTRGAGLVYFFWDAEKSGFLRNSGGELRAENADIRRLVVANPLVQNIQDQEWIIYAVPEKIGALKKKYDLESKDLVSDGYLIVSETEKVPVALDNDDELVTVFIKWFKNKEGEVFYTIATQNRILVEPRPMNPYYDEKKKIIEHPNTTVLMDGKDDNKGDKRSEFIWDLYPFAKLSLNVSDNDFYSTPIAYEYIEAQKSINNHYSIYDKALQDNVLGGFIVKEGVLGEQEITTENGQILHLNVPLGEPITNVIGRLPVAQIPADSARYSASLLDVTRNVAGASNVQLGIADFSGQSGRQTEMLLQRAKENASSNAMLFTEFKKDQAYIMFLFAKFYYDNESFVVVKHGDKENDIRQYSGNDAFKGETYLDDRVMIDIRVGASPAFSEYTNIELLGLMVQSGQLPFEAYIRMLPEGYISNKEEMIKIAENNSNKKIQELTQYVEEQQQVMEQMKDAYEKVKKDFENVDVIIRENERLRSMLAETTAKTIEAIDAVTAQSKQVTEDMAKLVSIMNK